MKYFNAINNHKYIYLSELAEPKDNSLEFKIEEAIESGSREATGVSETRIEGLNAIEVTKNSAIYRVQFPGYIAYSIRDESYAIPDDYEIFEGRLLCIYSRSHFLDYINKSTFACDDHPGPFKNYGFNCLNHIVDVVSSVEPIIELIRGRDI